MSLEKLIKLVPPPPAPLETGSANDWIACEQMLKIGLPPDYKQFIEQYGTGTLAGFLFVYNPFATETGLNLLQQWECEAESLNQLHAESPGFYPYSMFPSLPGLIPWGGDSNGNRYFWIVKKGVKPGNWQVTINEGGEGFQNFKGGFSKFVVALLQGQLDFSSVDFAEDELTFKRAASASSGQSSDTAMDAVADDNTIASNKRPRTSQAAAKKSTSGVTEAPRSNAMQTIVELLPPPTAPKGLGTPVSWTKAERQFRTALPTDWREFCLTYGSFGSIEPAGLVLDNPLNKVDWSRIKGRLNWFAREWKKASDPAVYPYAVFPEPGGLFPLGNTLHGQELFFKTAGSPEEWTVVILDEVRVQFYEHRMSLTEFLAALLQGKPLQPFQKDWISQRGTPLTLAN